jgi:hypothetical protein
MQKHESSIESAPQDWDWLQNCGGIMIWDSLLIGDLVSIPLQAIQLYVCALLWAHQITLREGASVVYDRSAQEGSKTSKMKPFKLPSQHRAVELRAAQLMLMRFTRLKSSQPIDGIGTSVIDRPTLARQYHRVLVRASLGRLPDHTG